MWWLNFSMTQYDSIVINFFHEENTSIFQWLYVCHSFVPMKYKTQVLGNLSSLSELSSEGKSGPLVLAWSYRAVFGVWSSVRCHDPSWPIASIAIAMPHGFEDVLTQQQTRCDPSFSAQVHSFTTQLMESIWWRRSRPRSLYFWGKFWKGQLLNSLKFFGELSGLLSFIWVDHGHLMAIWCWFFSDFLRYYDHIKNNPETLVVRFLGLHCLRVQKRVSRFRRSEAWNGHASNSMATSWKDGLVAEKKGTHKPKPLKFIMMFCHTWKCGRSHWPIFRHFSDMKNVWFRSGWRPLKQKNLFFVVMAQASVSQRIVIGFDYRINDLLVKWPVIGIIV